MQNDGQGQECHPLPVFPISGMLLPCISPGKGERGWGRAIACRYRIRVLFGLNATDLGFPQLKSSVIGGAADFCFLMACMSASMFDQITDHRSQIADH